MLLLRSRRRLKQVFAIQAPATLGRTEFRDFYMPCATLLTVSNAIHPKPLTPVEPTPPVTAVTVSEPVTVPELFKL